MLHVLTCIIYDHDLGLVACAAVICALASVSSFSLAERARRKSGSARQLWLVAAAVAAGYGVWATHFISMLAYNLHVASGYDISLTILSALIAVMLSGVGFYLATTERLPAWRTAAGGAIAGLGISAMHYLGMA